MESVDLSDDDDEPPTLTKDTVGQFTICSAPSTPTGARDPPVAFRRGSVNAATTDDLSQIDIKYQGTSNNASTTSDDGAGLIGSFLGCLKPIFSVVNKFGENIKYTRDATTAAEKTAGSWLIPIDSIMNDLVLIGTGIEGSVYRGKLDGQNVACKRVKTEEETNIKHLRKLNHVNVIKFRGESRTRSVHSQSLRLIFQVCRFRRLCSTSSWTTVPTARCTTF